MNLNAYHVPEIDQMPNIPQLPLPDYAKLNKAFRETLLDPSQHAFTFNTENGHPNFAAYLQSDSNEMVTWGILAVGEWLLNRDTKWIQPTYTDFYSKEYRVFLNSPGHPRIEHWYMFYVNTLACAVAATLFDGDGEAMARIGSAADTLCALARRLAYDFYQQGYFFDRQTDFTNRDIYRQPDSIAGFAYAMLFAAVRAGRPQYMQECALAIQKYLSFEKNPWYEIPNGSAGLYTAAWLSAHGADADVKKAAGWVFDHTEGALQTGKWGKEEIGGLMMGWRGDDRPYALGSAYSMETLMPLQFILPAVRYEPSLAASVAKYALNALSAFQLFYAQGTEKLIETKPGLSAAIPYEKLIPGANGGQPVACGDFHGHRSIYGAGYLYWVEAMAVKTNESNIPAFDLSITDWLMDKAYPVFLLHNPEKTDRRAAFAPAPVWHKKCPALFQNGYELWDLVSLKRIGGADTPVPLKAGETALVAALPGGVVPVKNNGLILADNILLCKA